MYGVGAFGDAVHTVAGQDSVWGTGAPASHLVQGIVLPVDPQSGSVQRGGTKAIVSEVRSAGKFVTWSGLVSTAFYMSICVSYMWFAATIPETCNTHLADAFIGLGILNGLQGLVMARFVFVANTMLSAMSHSAIADKYRMEGREEEADSEETDYEAEAKLASRSMLLPSCMYVLILNLVIFFLGFGAMQAMQSDDRKCGGGAFIYWVFLIMSLFIGCLSGAAGQSAIFAPQGRLV